MTDTRPVRRNGTRPPRESRARAAERRADRRLRLTLLAVVGAVLLGLVLVVVVGGDDESGSTETAKVRAGAVVPTGVSATTWAVTAYPGVTPKPGAPTLEVWEDFQCPACAATEERTGDLIESLARSGEIRLVWRPTTFLDERLGNDASQRAVEAWGCAVDAGVGPEYHRTVFANQPPREGDGYTDEQLMSFGRTAGLSGSAQEAFEQCATSGRYRQWAVNSTAAFYDAGVPGTPAGYLDGEELPSGTLADGKALLAAVRAAG